MQWICLENLHKFDLSFKYPGVYLNLCQFYLHFCKFVQLYIWTHHWIGLEKLTQFDLSYVKFPGMYLNSIFMSADLCSWPADLTLVDSEVLVLNGVIDDDGVCANTELEFPPARPHESPLDVRHKSRCAAQTSSDLIQWYTSYICCRIKIQLYSSFTEHYSIWINGWKPIASLELLFMFIMVEVNQLLLAPDVGTRTKSSSIDEGSLQSSKDDQGPGSSSVEINAMSRPKSSDEKDVSSSGSSHCAPGDELDVGDRSEGFKVPVVQWNQTRNRSQSTQYGQEESQNHEAGQDRSYRLPQFQVLIISVD